MIYNTRKNLFESYFRYYIIKLKLNKKFKFDLKQDNRIDCLASVDTAGKNAYLVKYNVKKLTTEWKIIHTVLHEIRHLSHDFRESNEIKHEEEAELFALQTIQKDKPEFYKKCVNWTRELMKDTLNQDEVHRQAYYNVLRKLKEF